MTVGGVVYHVPPGIPAETVMSVAQGVIHGEMLKPTGEGVVSKVEAHLAYMQRKSRATVARKFSRSRAA
jgi:hypothetical protein